jgi:metal-responsive CopG/Arc/MetJ family transcriptional regulator
MESRVSIYVPTDLLTLVDHEARRQGRSRSNFIAQAIRAAIRAEAAKPKQPTQKAPP